MNHNKTLRSVATSLLAGCLLGAIVAFPSDASAWWVREDSVACVRSNADFFEVNEGAGINNVQAGYLCAVPDTSATPKTAINTTNVELYADGGSWSAKPCYADWDGQTGGCDSATFVGGAGHQTIALGGGDGFFDTDSGADFAFVDVEPNGDTGRIAGIYYTN